MEIENEIRELVSIIVPVYNVAAYLDECVQSIGGTAVTNFSVTAFSNSGNTGSAATPTPSAPTAGITNVQPNGGTQAAQKTTVNAKAPVTGEASPVSCVVLALIIVGGFALLIAELRRSRRMQKKH